MGEVEGAARRRRCRQPALALRRSETPGVFSFLFQEIEKAKSCLSEQTEAVIRFRAEDIDIEEKLSREEFERLIAADQATVRRCMQGALTAAGVKAGDIDSVFLTGGSAQIPAIRRMFAEEFGEEKLKAQDYITSVAFGLGLSALRSAAGTGP